jgi:hypothetical protein
MATMTAWRDATGSNLRVLSCLTMPKEAFDLRAWALVGAQQRLRELDEERAAIMSYFPQLRGEDSPRRRGPGRSPKAQDGDAAAFEGTQDPTLKKRRRRKVSAEARAKISAAQRLRWKKQKAAAKK